MQAHVQTLSRLLPEEEIQELLASGSIPANETPLWEHWPEFAEWYLDKGRSEETVRRVRDSARFFIRNTPLKTIESCNDHIVLEKALRQVKKDRGVQHITLNTYLKSLRTYFYWLADYKYIHENNLEKIKLWKEKINEQYTYSHDQVERIKVHTHYRKQTTMQRYRNDLFIGLIALIGARPVELLHIKISDIKEEKGQLVLRLQGAKQKGYVRPYLLENDIKDSFLAYINYLEKIGRKEEYLFVSSSKKGRWTDKGMRCLFRDLSKELGFRVTAYAFRHYVPTVLDEEGMDLREIATYMGHTRISTTLRYIQRNPSQTQAASHIMERVLSRNLSRNLGFNSSKKRLRCHIESKPKRSLNKILC